MASSWWSSDTIAVVTGAYKGIGLEIVRQLAEQGLTVVLTARDKTKGQAAVDALIAKGLKSVAFHQLDVSNSESVQNLASWLRTEYGGIDILVNNAGVGLVTIDYESAKITFDINYYAVKKVTAALLPLLRPSPAGARIVNVSSRAGSYELHPKFDIRSCFAQKCCFSVIEMLAREIDELDPMRAASVIQRLPSESLKETFRNEGNYTEDLADLLAIKYLEDMKVGRAVTEGWLPVGTEQMYGESKMCMNVYSKALAKTLEKSQPEDHKIFVAGMCPGVTWTDLLRNAMNMGHEPPKDFPMKTPEEGAETAVWLCLLPKEEWQGKSGRLFAERAEYSFGKNNYLRDVELG